MAAARDIYKETLNGSSSTCNCDECCGSCLVQMQYLLALAFCTKRFCIKRLKDSATIKHNKCFIVAEIRFTAQSDHSFFVFRFFLHAVLNRQN